MSARKSKSILSLILGCALSAVVLPAIAAPSPYFQTVTSLNPAGYWPMHETGAPARGDIETNYGTLGPLGTGYYADWVVNVGAFKHGFPGALNGNSDTAVYFTEPASNAGAPTNSLYVPRTSPRSALNPPFSVECWFYGTNNNEGDIWSECGYEGFDAGGADGAGGGNVCGIRLYWGGPGFTVYSYNNSTTLNSVNANGTYAAGKWYHVVVTDDGNFINMFVNGINQTNHNQPANMYAPDYWTPFVVGNGRGHTRGVNGIVDEVAVYTNILTDIAAHYSAGTNASPNPNYFQLVTNDHPVIYLRMDSPAYTPPPVATWPVLQNYGRTNGVAVGNGVYNPGTMPGIVSGPFNFSGAPFAGLAAAAATNIPQFSGVSSFADAGYARVYDPTGAVPFSVTAMFRGNPCDNRFQNIIGHSDKSWRIAMNFDGALQCTLGTNSGSILNSVGIYNDGNWHQVVEVYTPSSVPSVSGTNALYVDGALDCITNGVSPNGIGPGSPLDVMIAADPQYTNSPIGPGRQFAGQVCEVAFFNGALTAAQVQSLYLSATSPPSPPLFVNQPSNTTVVELAPAYFSAAVNGNPPPAFQWYLNGAVIPGATSATCTIPSVPFADNNASVVLVASSTFTNVSFSVTSSPAILTVIADTNPPVLLGAQSLGLNQVELGFSKRISTATATNLSNYSLTGGLVVSGAALDASQSNVVLAVSTMSEGSPYTVTVNNLADQTVHTNVIASNSQASFIASSYVSAGIGSPPNGGEQIPLTNGVAVSGIGADVGGTADQFQFSYKLVTGDFDLSVCLQNLNLSDIWAKAGLMARASLDAGSPFAASFATPSMAGDFFEYRGSTNGAAALAGRFPANYPNVWLRLTRSGSTFGGYASFDGQTWSLLGSATISMPNQIYFGLAVSSHNSSQSTTAQFFLPFNTLPGATVGPAASPYELPGPCSRKTGIDIYEINYKPAPRTDGNNVEYLELYNSQPYFHDISGYSLTCADMNYTFPPNTIMQAGQFLVVAASPSSITSVYGITNVIGPYTGSLKKSETLELLDEQGNILLTVPYSGTYPWPVAADGTGHSIFLANPSYGEGDPRAWAISDLTGGSPGAAETYHPSPLRDVLINEILAHSESSNVLQFIELYNHSNQTNDLSGCILTDDPGTNKFIIAPGTLVAPRGFVSFDQSQLGFALNGAGGTVYFIKPDGSRILDAVQYEPQADGVSFGRSPDGANDFYFLQTRTPGAANSPISIGNIVINELMYKPISGNDDDQYIELYNQGTNAANLSGWQFTAGVIFTMPANAVLAPNGYLVVAANLTNLFAKYTNLNSANTVGNYGGHLSHGGERVALAQPMTLDGTNILVVEDEVTYNTGGRWGEWASGGGSSLELIDPHSNHRLAANWADSDETQKSAWTNIEYTGVMDNGSNFESGVLHAQIGILDVGECLVDNIEVDDTNGVNYVSNPDFESGLANWAMQGCMVRSSLENSGYNSSYSLHLRCSDRFWTGINSCQVSLNPNTFALGQTATLRFKARWLRGWPEPILRMNGNWLEATAAMPVPSNLGTPGLPNSMLVTNAGPALYSVTHSPTLPVAGQNVVVSTRVHDPDGVQNLTLNYRIDPATSYISVPMTDDGTNGTNGDSIAGDSIFSATIPSQSSNTIVAFCISATDNPGAATRFPALLNDGSPMRECLIRFGDANPPESFGAYHFWCSATNVTRWSTLGDLSNEGIDCTYVNNTRVVYNILAHYGGSPYHQSFNSPSGNLCSYDVDFPDDDMMLGTTSFNRIHQPGNSPGSDASIQREQTCYTFMRALGEPWLYRRNVAVLVNGNRRGTLMEDSQVPDGDMIKEHFPNDTDGFLYKMQPWFEFAPALSGYSLTKSNMSWCFTTKYTTTGSALKTARYRYMFEERRTPDSASNYTNVFAIVNAASAHGTSNYVAGMENICDMENWMRVFAVNHSVANSDSFGATTEQNLYGYMGTAGTKYTLMMWDLNICLDHGSWNPGQNLFLVNALDLNMTNIYLCPEFRRMYWRGLEDLVNGPLIVNNTAPLCDAKYNAFVADGLTGVENPDTSMLPWIGQAQTSIAAQLAAVDSSSFSVNPPVLNTNTGIVTFTGVAPVHIKTISVNGIDYTVTWTTLTNFTLIVRLQARTNVLNLAGVDLHGQPVPGATNVVTVVDNNILPPPSPDYIAYTNSDSVYFQNFDSLPNPGANSVNANNPVTINGVTYTPTNPFCFAEPITFGGMGISNLAGWYGLAGATAQFGATAGDQTTGGDISFGLPNGTNRALGLLATSSTTYTAFGAKFVNLTYSNFDSINLSFTGEVWRQSNLPKTLEFFYFVDPTGTNIFSTTNITAILPAFYVNFPVVAADTGGTNVNGTAATNQISLGVSHEFITNWPPNAALWLVWEMPDSTGKAQGLAIDNLSFSADYQTPPPPSPPTDYIPYTSIGSMYSQDFNSLPNPGTASVNAANPVTINSITYSLANPFCFAATIIPTDGGFGGLGLTNLAGWYGLAGATAQFGATSGDQTTGGDISFGLPNDSNRALGLLNTSSTAYTAFGAKFINQTPVTLNYINLAFTGEVWRQSNLPKTLKFFYSMDPTATNAFSTNITASLSALNVSLPTVAGDTSGVAVDGTAAGNQTNLAVISQAITNWPPGAALWIGWEMTDSTSKAQGLAVDNLTFSALNQNLSTFTVLAAPPGDTGGTNFILSWPTLFGLQYQVQMATNLVSPVWQKVGALLNGTGNTLAVTNAPLAAPGFYRIKILP